MGLEKKNRKKEEEEGVRRIKRQVYLREIRLEEEKFKKKKRRES
jgi:hypothetical protein